jgi:hypothetical protein
MADKILDFLLAQVFTLGVATAVIFFCREILAKWLTVKGQSWFQRAHRELEGAIGGSRQRT